MKAAIGWLIGLVFGVSASAEPLLEGRVRLESGEPVADAQVRIFDMTDLRQGAIARAQTDGTGYFALPLATLGGRALPARFALGPNYPNPFNPSTIIPYQLAASSRVRLEVFNLLGQHLATLVDGERPAGFHTATWHATDGAGRAVGAGVYIYRMTVGVESQTGRMVLIDGQAGVSVAGSGSVWSGASGSVGSDGEGAQVYGLIVSGSGLVPYVDSSFRVEAGMAPVELVVLAGHHSAGKVTDDCVLCDFFDAFNEAAEEKAAEEEAEEEEAETPEEEEETPEEEEDEVTEEEDETGEGDLIVYASVSKTILTPGQAFTLRATVAVINRGTDEFQDLVLSYYRSSNATISTQDMLLGTYEVGSLTASRINRFESISLTAPSPGTYYYGACVASVRDESDTLSNCSTGRRVIVDPVSTDFTGPQIYNDNVFVLPVTENLAAGNWPYIVVGNLPYRDYAARFYEHFNDEFDFLIFVHNMARGTQECDGGYYSSVKNDVEGIGQSIYFDGNWGSSEKLQGVIQFFGYFDFSSGDSCPGCSDIRNGTLLHEIMHRWGNFIVPITSEPFDPHWRFISSGGYLDGYDISNMIDHGDGKYSHEHRSSSQYSPIELYLAGFIPPEDVPDFQIAEDGKWLLDETGWPLEDDNGYRLFTASGFKTYTIEDIVTEYGPRVPDHSQAQKDFRAAVILLVSEDYPATRKRLERLSDDVSWISYVGETNTVWRGYTYSNFYEATGGRGTITMDDLSHFQRRASAKRLVPSSFGTPPPPIVDIRE